MQRFDPTRTIVRGIAGLTAAGLSTLTAVPGAPAQTSEAPPEAALSPTAIPPPVCDEALDWDSYEYESHGLILNGRDDWLFRSSTDFLMDFAISPPVRDRIARFVETLKANGTTLVMVIPPTRGILHFDELTAGYREMTRYRPREAVSNLTATLEDLRDTGAVVPNILEEALRAELDEPFFFPQDHHWTQAGSRLAAYVTAEAMRATVRYKQLPTRPYSNRIGDSTFDMQPAFAEILGELCGTEAPEIELPVWETTTAGSTNDAAGADELLEDAESPPVVLTGTSNSNKDGIDGFNFSGFLMEYTGLDVLNLSVAGGAHDVSLLSYLSSDLFQGDKPAFLVWEVPPYARLDDESLWAQALPSVWGECSENNALASSTVQAGEDEITLFADDVPDYAPDEELYLVLTMEDLSVIDFETRLILRDYSHQPIHVDRSSNDGNTGRFFVTFEPEDSQPIRNIRLRLPEDATGTVGARLCVAPEERRNDT